MKLVFCCEKMQENVNDEVVTYNAIDGNFIITLSSMEVALDYCPFCGTEIEVIDA